MSSLRIIAKKGNINGRISAPSSKSYTHRALFLASLADGESIIEKPLFSRDTNATMNSCTAIGASITNCDRSIKVIGTKPKLPVDVINVENSGTTLRFMASILTLTDKGFSVLTGDESIRRRPMQELLDALNKLGGNAFSARMNGCAPVIVQGGGLNGGYVEIRGDISSQFISSLLISTPKAENDTRIRVNGFVSRPYIDATIVMVRQFDGKVYREGEEFLIPARQRFKPVRIKVPGDFSSSSFIMAAVALLGGEVSIENLDTSMPQADSKIIEILHEMGVKVKKNEDCITISSDGSKLDGGRFDLRDAPDLLPVLSILGLRCKSRIEIINVQHARYKETDRISMLANELSKLGLKLKEMVDGIIIEPSEDLRPARLDAHNDHRLFMAFCIASPLFKSGCSISGVESLDVSYPNFLDDLEKIGLSAVGE